MLKNKKSCFFAGREASGSVFYRFLYRGTEEHASP